MKQSYVVYAKEVFYVDPNYHNGSRNMWTEEDLEETSMYIRKEVFYFDPNYYSGSSNMWTEEDLEETSMYIRPNEVVGGFATEEEADAFADELNRLVDA